MQVSCIINPETRLQESRLQGKALSWISTWKGLDQHFGIEAQNPRNSSKILHCRTLSKLLQGICRGVFHVLSSCLDVIVR